FSWWDSIRLLPAGHVLRVRMGKRVPDSAAYGQLQDCYVNRPTEPISRHELRHAIVESVKHHLVADVPVGIFLSAGIDSAVIAAVATEVGHRPITIMRAFEEYLGTEADEAPRAE